MYKTLLFKSYSNDFYAVSNFSKIIAIVLNYYIFQSDFGVALLIGANTFLFPTYALHIKPVRLISLLTRNSLLNA